MRRATMVTLVVAGVLVGLGGTAGAGTANHRPACVNHSPRYCAVMDLRGIVQSLRVKINKERVARHYPPRSFKRLKSWRTWHLDRSVTWHANVLNATRKLPYDPMDAEHWISVAFGSLAGEAWSVAHCESRLRRPTDADNLRRALAAQNGQYLGVWQMGNYARSRYGHGSTIREQALAAAAYRFEAGSWSPWACRPGGWVAY